MMGGSSSGGEGGNGRQSLPELLRPYNSYNIYFTLERVRLIEARRQEAKAGGGAGGPRLHPNAGRGGSPSGSVASFTGYERLELPPLPPRYEHLGTALPGDWCVPGKRRNAKRKHSKTHGLASFKEMAAIIAENWKAVDPVTKAYVEAVAGIQKERYYDLKRIWAKRPSKADRASNNEVASKRRMLGSLDEGPAEIKRSLELGVSDRPFPRFLTSTGLTESEHSLRLGASEHSCSKSIEANNRQDFLAGAGSLPFSFQASGTAYNPIGLRESKHSLPSFLTSMELIGNERSIGLPTESEHTPRLLAEGEQSLGLGEGRHSPGESVEGRGNRRGFAAAAMGLPSLFHAAPPGQLATNERAPPLTHPGLAPRPSNPSPSQDWPRLTHRDQAAAFVSHLVANEGSWLDVAHDDGSFTSGFSSADRNFGDLTPDGRFDERAPRQRDFCHGRDFFPDYWVGSSSNTTINTTINTTNTNNNIIDNSNVINNNNSNNNSNNINNVSLGTRFDEADVHDEDILGAYHSAN